MSLLPRMVMLAATSTFKTDWLNPHTAARQAVATVTESARRSFACPDSEDWVLYLMLQPH